ncbi:MnhB domain-containing protein [candidate division KSB1 bacterium]|nr:MnhB domain-containing protein [candidate division KSB1 bacterium]
MKRQTGMTLIVKTITRLTVWLIILYGFYIILHGHLTPGGGFGGGVIIALAFLNVLLAYGREFTDKWLKISFLEKLESLSIILFLLLGITALLAGKLFLENFIGKGHLYHLLSAGTIPVFNIIIGIKVAMSLFLVIWILSGLKLEEGEEA